MDAERVAIASSKGKLILLTLGALAFVAGGVFLLAIADTQGRYFAIYVKVVSVLAIGFFGLCAVYGLFKLLERAPGLVLDREGIIDNSSGVAAGRVPWREIEDIQVASVSGQQFLALVVKDPRKYLGRGNFVSRLFVRMNYKLYGTPVFISATSLKVDFAELARLLQDFRRRYGGA